MYKRERMMDARINILSVLPEVGGTKPAGSKVLITLSSLYIFRGGRVITSSVTGKHQGRDVRRHEGQGELCFPAPLRVPRPVDCVNLFPAAFKSKAARVFVDLASPSMAA